MGTCTACGKPTESALRAIEVRTLHVRTLGGEQRVQALGRTVDSAVCPDCAEQQLALERRPAAAAKRKLTAFGLILLAGILLAAFAGRTPWANALRMLGFAAVICGALGLFASLRDARERAAALKAMPEDEALDEAAFDVFRRYAPAREGENDLTYIPVNAASLRRRNGDLMVLYGLVPGIAAEAWNRLHPESADVPEPGEEQEGNPQD